MEGTPITINLQEVKQELQSIQGVIEVHDLHIWTITSGLDSLTCHILIEDDEDEQKILQQAINKIKEKYKIEHTTIQIEKSKLQHSELKV